MTPRWTQVLAWLEQADQSRGSRKPVLAVGRDGLMLPIRGEACYREGATATISVHDRRGRRLGTVYLGRMPEPGQETLSRQLTALLEDVLRRWTGPLPRLAYITDGGYQQTRYYRQVLKRMSDPRHPGQRLKWAWVVDYYHACEYIYKMADALFSDPKRAQAWARKMCRWLKTKPRGINRVLHSAAAIRRTEDRGRCEAQAIRQRLQLLAEADSLSGLLPIPSGSPADRQRGDRSGVQDGIYPTAEAVRDDLETGRRSMDRRSACGPIERPLVPGVSSILASEDASRNGGSGGFREEKAQKGRIIDGTGAITPSKPTRVGYASNTCAAARNRAPS